MGRVVVALVALALVACGSGGGGGGGGGQPKSTRTATPSRTRTLPVLPTLRATPTATPRPADCSIVGGIAACCFNAPLERHSCGIAIPYPICSASCVGDGGILCAGGIGGGENFCCRNTIFYHCVGNACEVDLCLPPGR